VKEIIGLITIILAIVGHAPYILDTIRGKTKPHLFTWLTWSFVVSLAFFGQLSEGAGAGAWSTGITGLLVIIIALLALKNGTKDITKTDSIFFVASLLAIIPWYLTNDPTISIIMATIIDACAFIPTIRKTIKDPSSETLATYALNLLRHGLSLLALSNYNLATVLYPSYLLVMNLILTGVMVRPLDLYQRYFLKQKPE